MFKGIADYFRKLFSPQPQEIISPIASWPVSAQRATPTPTIAPTPTPIPEMGFNPYRKLLEKYFKPEDVQKAENIMFLENRGFNPRMVHINYPEWRPLEIKDRNQWLELRRKYPSIDVGLFQINTAPAVSDYLAKKGWTYYGMMENPEWNIATAADLLYGRIPYTAAGWQNWVANKKLGY